MAPAPNKALELHGSIAAWLLPQPPARAQRRVSSANPNL